MSKYFDLMYKDIQRILIKKDFKFPKNFTTNEQKKFLELFIIAAETQEDYLFCEKVKTKLESKNKKT